MKKNVKIRGCSCDSCVEYYGDVLKKNIDKKCRICGRTVSYNMDLPPTRICNPCWKRIPKHIPQNQYCRYMLYKI